LFGSKDPLKKFHLLIPVGECSKKSERAELEGAAAPLFLFSLLFDSPLFSPNEFRHHNNFNELSNVKLIACLPPALCKV
jgi:hypothetical protein